MNDPTENSHMDKLDRHLMYLYTFRKDVDMERTKILEAINSHKSIKPDKIIIETNIQFLGSQYDSIIKKLSENVHSYITKGFPDLRTVYNDLEDFKDEINYRIDILQEIQYAYGRQI